MRRFRTPSMIGTRCRLTFLENMSRSDESGKPSHTGAQGLRSEMSAQGEARVS
jgi:hypothetical protein